MYFLKVVNHRCDLTIHGRRVFGAREKWQDHQIWQLECLRGLVSIDPINFMTPGVDEHIHQYYAVHLPCFAVAGNSLTQTVLVAPLLQKAGCNKTLSVTGLPAFLLQSYQVW